MRIILFVLVALASAVTAGAQDFTIEINRGQADAVTLTAPKTSPNGLAFTWAFEQHNLQLVGAGDPPLANEPIFLRGIVILPALQSWRRQQLNVGVVQAYRDANEATKASVRSLLGL